jgi:serine/threonine protein phosphatase 1
METDGAGTGKPAMFDIAACAEASAVVRFPINGKGRDFVVGDIHGMFAHLQALLLRIDFNPELDRLFSVGDLVDRGPSSREALRWLRLSWFHACRGNHEQFAIDSVLPEELEYWVHYNGGGWWMDLSNEERRVFREAFLGMPLAMEVETASGVVGVVHADVPPALTWDRFARLLSAGHSDIALYAMCSRHRVQGGDERLGPVAGEVSRVYCGHTPVREPVAVDNVYFIDTGAVYIRDGYTDARLTLIQIHPEPHREYSIRCELEV